jgi:predicted O-methyltransferase YrrM
LSAEAFKKIIEDHKISWVIETGTYYGATTKHLTAWTEKVDTIEVVKKNFDKATETLKGIQNVNIHFGNSSEILDTLFASYNKKGRRPNLLCFLDAHWQEYNPLLDELSVIAKWKWKPIIAIHDFKVPDHPELGYDTYKDIVYEWEWIKQRIENIYGEDGYTLEYNSEAEGAKRGVVFIFPKK